MMGMCLIVLCWLGYNAWTILLRQRKWRVLPLSVFYAIATLLMAIDFIKMIYYWEFIPHWFIMPFLYPQTLKFLLGVEQIWINLELIYSIKYSLEVANKT